MHSENRTLSIAEGLIKSKRPEVAVSKGSLRSRRIEGPTANGPLPLRLLRIPHKHRAQEEAHHRDSRNDHPRPRRIQLVKHPTRIRRHHQREDRQQPYARSPVPPDAAAIRTLPRPTRAIERPRMFLGIRSATSALQAGEKNDPTSTMAHRTRTTSLNVCA